MFLATPLPRSCGVYEITNLVTGENYIGSSPKEKLNDK